MACDCRLAQAGALSNTSDLTRLREQVMTAKDQLLQLDVSPLLAGKTAQSRKPGNALLRRVLHAPLYA